MTRTLSRGLATIVEELELAQPTLVTMEQLSNLAARHGIGTEPKVLARRLRTHGWLLATGTPGVWEFAPGAHAGPYGRGDPVIAFRAALERAPELTAALAHGSAAWAHNLADRVPSRLDIAVAHGTPVPVALRRTARVTSFTSNLDYLALKGVHAHRIETILVHLAAKPSDVRSWSSVQEWLPDLALEADVDFVARELADRPAAVQVRAGYLLQGVRPDISDQLRTHVGAKVWFGSRGSLRRHSAQWQVADTLLPFDPASLAPGQAG